MRRVLEAPVKHQKHNRLHGGEWGTARETPSGERIGSGDRAAFESGEGHGVGGCPSRGAGRTTVVAAEGDGVATANTGGQGGGEEGVVGVKRVRQPPAREGRWLQGQVTKEETSGRRLRQQRDGAGVERPRSGSG